MITIRQEAIWTVLLAIMCFGSGQNRGWAQTPVIQPAPSGTVSLSVSDRQTENAPVPIGQSYLCSDGNCGYRPQVNSCFEDGWATLTPYFWLPAMKGQIGLGPGVADVNLSLSDTFDLLSDLKGAAMLHAEIGRGGNGLLLDTLLTRFESTEALPIGGTGTVDASMTFLEGIGFRRIVSADRCSGLVRRVNWDFLYGARYYQIGTAVTLANQLGNPVFSRERTEPWLDLVLGARTFMKLDNGSTVFARADFGGFGMGSSSDFAWNLHVGLMKPLRNNPNASLVLGYKILDIQQSKGSGAQTFLFDMNMQGPFSGLTFRF